MVRRDAIGEKAPDLAGLEPFSVDAWLIHRLLHAVEGSGIGQAESERLVEVRGEPIGRADSELEAQALGDFWRGRFDSVARWRRSAFAPAS